MTRTLAVLAGAVAFFTAIVAVRDHSALVRAGYELSEMARQKERLILSTADHREQIGRLGSPSVLEERALALGLSPEYRRERVLVRSGSTVFPAPAVAWRDAEEVRR